MMHERPKPYCVANVQFESWPTDALYVGIENVVVIVQLGAREKFLLGTVISFEMVS